MAEAVTRSGILEQYPNVDGVVSFVHGTGCGLAGEGEGYEALERTQKPEIRISTAFRPGIRISVQGVSQRISLPLEIVIEDNGPGIPSDLLPILFDPFVTTKPNGSGLGLALVAKIVGDHGGVIDSDSRPGRTRFRVLLPVASGAFVPETEEALAK